MCKKAGEERLFHPWVVGVVERGDKEEIREKVPFANSDGFLS